MAPRPPNDTGTGGGDLSGFVAALQRALCLGAVALYGSRGRGDHFPDSDYDFVVVSSSFDGLNPLRRREKPYEAWAATGPGRGADIFGLTPQELLAMESPLIWDMLEDGRPLFDDGVWRRAVAEFRIANPFLSQGPAHLATSGPAVGLPRSPRLPLPRGTWLRSALSGRLETEHGMEGRESRCRSASSGEALFC